MAESAADAIGAAGVVHDANVSKVSVVGQGMEIHTGVATVMFEALAAARVNIQMITTSEIKISVLVDRAARWPGLRVVHDAFGLEQPVNDMAGPYTPRGRGSAGGTLATPAADDAVNGLRAWKTW